MPKLNYLIFFILLFPLYLYGQESADYYIRKVLLHQYTNQGLKYQLTSYNNLIITADPKDSYGHIDTIYKFKKGNKVIKEIDSSDYKFKKIISKQHLYQAEKISIITKNNKNIKEEIIATRMAGFKEPIVEYFTLQLHPFNLYNSKLEIAEKEYINPISEKGLTKYLFSITNYVSDQNRKLVQITFCPKNNKNPDLVKGDYFIDTENFNIARAYFYTLGKIECHSYHHYNYNKTVNTWFPLRTQLILKKGNSKYPVKILGEYITFEGSEKKYNPTGKKYASDFIEIIVTTQYSKFTLGDFVINKKYFPISLSNKASKRKESTWFESFQDSIDKRSLPTYLSLDSLIDARKYENKLKIGRKIIKGYYPIVFFDLDLRYLFRYNNHEGIRLGLGGITNDHFSKYFRTEAYFGYGTKDYDFKKGASVSLLLDRSAETWLGFGYQDDITEIANNNFEINKKAFKIYDSRPFNLTTFYNHRTLRAFIENKIIPKTESILQITKSNITPLFKYRYETNGNSYKEFNINTFCFSSQWNPFSKYMQTPSGRIEYRKEYPRFTFQFSKTFPNSLNDVFQYTRFDFRFEYQKKVFNNHKIDFQLEMGYIDGKVPITHLYSHSPNNLQKEKIIERVNFAGRDSFETMFFNEFFSNKQLYTHIQYQFSKWEINRQINPIFNAVLRYGIGNLNAKENHKDITFKTLDKGYWESGIEITQIYNGLGISSFYRFGPNQLPTFKDNLAIKLSLIIDLGFNN
ncbi:MULTISPECIES: DUF5686 family protein [Flavobacterium]|uniref:Carboxypeptidase-like regulatory domain-containing protein n=2 Tax=Flavobacterium TaxID=237 RepID=A0AA94F1X3_9FLAO|nr:MULTISPECIES: DUF5686 family protein [Flavobacterium]OXA80254.1 hypothetical protein B0A56_07045 [Flavobacterium columnare NBRC 100251 = ATCC 23463]AMA48274.1 hypothetical protein AWN65_01710 [Flavobacterium covae]AND63562.1 hypothetical protein AX766_03645 [Flavobacterium covae]MCH4830193.1 carboxypeptidase-like regulatory domain-containing protein [Flavobacterium columnare]MCH4832425.1 carboxypeptidase-like regulatory domain-containing protein [Flavobacterium columnare]